MKYYDGERVKFIPDIKISIAATVIGIRFEVNLPDFHDYHIMLTGFAFCCIHFVSVWRGESLSSSTVIPRKYRKFAFERLGVHSLPDLCSLVEPHLKSLTSYAVLSFPLTEACFMAFTPQSSPTRVSNTSCAILSDSQPFLCWTIYLRFECFSFGVNGIHRLTVRVSFI